MKKNYVNQLSLSNLSFFVLDEKSSDDLKLECESELINRLKKTNIHYLDLLDYDYNCIEERGYDINQYLFGENPSMQLLMELYYTECFDSIFDKNNLLFSERHLCNSTDVVSSFFTDVTKIEMSNLSVRMNHIDSDMNQVENLVLFYNALLSRTNDIQELKKDVGSFTERLESTDAMKVIHDIQRNESDDSFTLAKFIYQDSRKLSRQKQLLLSQVKSGYAVNYETDMMETVYQKVKQNVGFRKVS